MSEKKPRTLVRRIMRRCVGINCGVKFQAYGKFNRLCPRCSKKKR